jgi:hypothetical protein
MPLQREAFPLHPAIRLSCTECGSHVMVPGGVHRPGGQCPTCRSYDLVPVERESGHYPLASLGLSAPRDLSPALATRRS